MPTPLFLLQHLDTQARVFAPTEDWPFKNKRESLGHAPFLWPAPASPADKDQAAYEEGEGERKPEEKPYCAEEEERRDTERWRTTEKDLRSHWQAGESRAETPGGQRPCAAPSHTRGRAWLEQVRDRFWGSGRLGGKPGPSDGGIGLSLSPP